MKRVLVFLLPCCLTASASCDELSIVSGRLQIIELKMEFSFRNDTDRDLVFWESPGFIKRLHFELWVDNSGFRLYDRDYVEAIMGGFVDSNRKVLAPGDRFSVTVLLDELTPIRSDLTQKISDALAVSHSVRIRAVLGGNEWEAISAQIEPDAVNLKYILEGVEGNQTIFR